MTTGSPAASGAQLRETLRQVEMALRRQDMTLAMRLSDEAVAKGLEHSHLLVLAAHHQLSVGAPHRAFELATQARANSPRDIDVLNVAGLSLARLGRMREAVATYDAALRQSPTTVSARFNKACALEDMHELARARTEFERILDQQPAHVEALAHLADLAVQRSDLKVARECASRILRRDSGHIAAHLALAEADIEEKKFAEALVRLESLTRTASGSAVNLSIAQGLTGDALEGLGRTTDAFAAWSASQATLHGFYEPIFSAKSVETARARVVRLKEFFDSRAAGSWRSADDPYESAVRNHVFLVGFPRSGTTLMEQVLACHPDVESMEERDCLVDAVNDFISPADGLDLLAALPESGLAKYREGYWRRVADEGASLAKPVFVDKMPLNSVLLCAIARLFPRAKVLFAVRDPRDIVLSCFRRRFVMTPQMYELTTLEGAAGYYVAVMQLCETYRRELGVEFCNARYEDLVSEFDAECGRICTFIGVEWNESMRGFAQRARAGVIHTPSAPQVARGLFSAGMGQWRRYRDELAPVLPSLAPWVTHFGYPAD